jgi:biotin carboxyl carrier protein
VSPRALLGVAGCIAVAITLTACVSDPDIPEQTPDETTPVTVAVERRTIESVVVVDGLVVARPHVYVLSPARGQVDVNARTGQEVEAGEVLGTVDGSAVKAPASGTIVETLLATGTAEKNTPVVVIESSGWGVDITVPAEDLYRLYERPTQGTVNVTSGPAGLGCIVSASPELTEPGRLMCLIADGATLAPGLPARVGLPTAVSERTLALPLVAVAGRVDRGTVARVLSDGATETAQVSLGISDGTYIEILGGLREGDRVTPYPPGLG